jgi:hypothetical protein
MLPDDLRDRPETHEGRRIDVAAGPAWHVVHDDREPDRVANRLVVLIQALGRRLVVVRRHAQQPGRPCRLHAFAGLDDFVCVVAAGAREHGHAAFCLGDNELHDPDLFFIGQRRHFSGRSARHEKVDAGVDLAFGETRDARFVERAVALERGHHRRAASGERESHHSPPRTSFIVYQPRLP